MTERTERDFSWTDSTPGTPTRAADVTATDDNSFDDECQTAASPFSEALEGEAPSTLPTQVGDTAVQAQLSAVGAASGLVRDRLIEDFLRSQRDLIAFVARRQCRVYRLSYSSHYDEIHALVAATAWQILAAIGTPGAPEIESWPAYLTMKSRTQVRIHTQSPAHTGVSGSTAAIRRHQTLTSLLSREKASRGVDDLPTEHIQKVIDAYNDDIAERRVDAAHQGALLSLDDMASIQLVQWGDTDSPQTFTLDEAEIAQFEMVDVIRSVITMAYAERHDLGVIAQAYYGPYLADGEADRPRPADIANSTSLNRMKVSRGIMRIHELSREVLAEHGVVRETPTGDADLDGPGR